MPRLGALTIHLIFTRSWNFTSDTQSYIEGITFEILLGHRNLLDHRLFASVFVTCNANIVAVVVIDIRGCHLYRFPTIILLEAFEDIFPHIFTNVRVEERTIMLP